MANEIHKLQNALTIFKPEIVPAKSGVRIQAEFEVNGKKDVLWYEVEERYGHYLTQDRVDGFLVGLLLFASKNNYDIKVAGPLSNQLFYQLNKYVLPVISQVYGHKPIKVFCEHLTYACINTEQAVGTGLSCGIDSFSTIYENLVKEDSHKFKITHFANFNVGSHGSLGGDKARDLFHKRAAKAKVFVDELGMDLIMVDSNISEILQLNFESTHTFRSMSVVLILQRLFGVYYYSSAFNLKESREKAYYEIFNMAMLSTESINLYSSGSAYTRVEKTRLVGEYTPAYKYLDVCVMGDFNCGKCFKCARTLLTLEIIGKIENFSSVFDLEAYRKIRANYIAEVIADREKDIFKREIYDEIMRTNYEIPVNSKLASLYLKTKSLIRDSVR
ncbi:hypothetical protein BEP19_02200 [Ammoniphilus oxalaticus]|uniref:Uncharacterized protein n=1 Tax=Ammoniphilus oxalaticus TaxID=66863 RepID=A0A419SNB5_9BACL|nr:hypothetical protein [Ammoniphilus oxalaticus]RKD25775.1 hypothetical protein BEP19_02200 [Ammoniphilus oxalaticus]